jgi:phenylacetate-CoA ligase
VDIPLLSVLSHVAWPAPLAPPAANRLATLFQLEHSQWWPADELRRAQFRQLRELVPYAVRHVPHYAQTLARFTDAAQVTPENWSQVPLLTRSQLGADPKRIVSRQVPRDHGRQAPMRTSGSTGVAVDIVATELTEFFWGVYTLREHFWHRRDFSQKLMAIRYPRGQDKPLPGPQRSPQWGTATDAVVRTGAAVMYDVRLDISYLADQLIAERPGYLLGHASVLGGLIEHCERRGIKPHGLLELRPMGEMMPFDLRERAREAWGVPVVDMYTCQEAGYLALQCPEHEHYHVQAENVLLEVLDDHDAPCRPGEVGRVVVTALHNFATPLIRYEVGDYAEVGETCPCGRGLPVLKRIVGRHRNLLTLPSGERRWPKMGYEGLRRVVPVDLMQIVQHALDDVEVRLAMPQPLTAEQQQALTEYIHRNFGHPFPLRFTYGVELRNPKTGKLEQFISMLPARTA